MTVIEKSIEEKLRNLYKLQMIDSKLDEIEIMKGELPVEVSDLEDEIAGLEIKKSKFEQSMAELKAEIEGHKEKINTSTSLIEKYTRQLDDVKNNREFEALNKEIEMQNLEIQIKDIGGVETNKKEALTAVSKKLDYRKKDLKIKKDELKSIIEKTEEEEKALFEKSETARKDIEARLLKAYDKIRGAYRNGLAVVPIRREACGGCFNKIPPQQQIEIGIMKNIIACEHCGRVLVDDLIINQLEEA
jgi:uncharacterized protein